MATPVQQNLVNSNEQYASSFTQGHLPLPPGKRYLVVTCMDARIDPAAAFGIALGDAHIIRNAGGNAEDALRSILISQHLLGTTEVVLVKHTGCGMLTFTNDQAHAAVARNGGTVQSGLDFQPFPELDDAVRRDVEWLRRHGGLIKGVELSGWVYEVESGRVRQVV